MDDCKHLNIEDITQWHGDVFDHPSYEYRCKLTNKKVITRIQCNSNRCKRYEVPNE